MTRRVAPSSWGSRRRRPTLASWRTERAASLGLDGAEDLLALLINRTGFTDTEARIRLTQAANGDGAAMVAVADRLGAGGGDLTWSWLALAALVGDRAAGLQVASELMRRSEESDGSPRDARRLALVARTWLRPLVSEIADAFGPLRRQLFSGLAVAGKPLRSGVGPAATATEPRPEPDRTPDRSGEAAMVVIRGEVTAGFDDAADPGRDFAPLARPMPLLGGPAPAVLAATLSLEFPWLAEAIDAVTGDLRLRAAMGIPWYHCRPLLLTGASGTGKTAFVRRLAQLTGLGYGEFNAAGSTDNRLLAGTARGWAGARPSHLLEIIRRCGSANPLVLVDEIDKTEGGGRNGDIRETLLAMLEPSTAKGWLDECLCVPVDLSAVSWVLTANDTWRLRGPLLTRLRVVTAPPPGAGHLDAVLAGIRRRLAADYGVSEGELPDLPARIEAALRRACLKGSDLRRLRAGYECGIRSILGGRRHFTLH